MEDDFMLDDDEDLVEDYVIQDDEEEDENEQEEEELPDKPVNPEEYEGKLTKDEIWLSAAYDDIVAATKKNDERVSVGGKMFEANIIDAVRAVLKANPVNTSPSTVEFKVMELFHTQGHNRIPASIYTPDKPIRSDSVDEEFGGTDDDGFNQEYAKQARDQIARFVEYLSTRDLSKDTIVSKRRKQRQLPAFIIFLFSSNMYDLILNCPTMPEEYQSQIDSAFRRIQKQKYDVVEALAQRYESRGRDAVAERVRKLGLAWFDKEPAEILTASNYADLKLDYQDVVDYREFRPRFINASRSVTQEFVSDLIEVVIEPGKINEKLKDKTRGDAIADVKKVYKNWAKENTIEDSELADKIVWKDLKLIK